MGYSYSAAQRALGRAIGAAVAIAETDAPSPSPPDFTSVAAHSGFRGCEIEPYLLGKRVTH
jgi:hypothetical protein